MTFSPVVLDLADRVDALRCARTGRDGLPDDPFYHAFNLFRLAAIFPGIKGRVRRGAAANALARERAEAFPRLAVLARRAMAECLETSS